MEPLSKEQIQKLSPSQLDAFAEIQLQLSARRAELLRQLPGSRKQVFLAACGSFSVVFVYLFIIAPKSRLPFELMWILSLFVFIFLVQIQTTLCNRRIDALVELLKPILDPPPQRRAADSAVQ